MRYKGLIITGTSCSGKSTIVNELVKPDESADHFTQVRAVTTRKRRSDDTRYDYVTNEMFEKLKADEKLLVSDSYRDKQYGIKKEEYEKALSNNEIPVLVITPSSASRLVKDSQDFMCVFVDASNEELIERYKTRSGKDLKDVEKKEVEAQRERDRENADVAHYVLRNKTVQDSTSLIKDLWRYNNQGGGLPKQLISKMISCGMLLENADLGGVKGASYDLRLGDEYYYGGEIRRLSTGKPFLTIEPYDYAIVSCEETACIPRNIIAKFGLSVGLFCQGIILSNGPQIDPGFRGTLFCLLFNTSNRAVHIKRGQHYATIEFNKLLEFADSYKGKYQDKKSIIDYIPENALYGAINELKKDIERLRNESRLMQNIYLAVVALMFTIISLLLAR